VEYCIQIFVKEKTFFGFFIKSHDISAYGIQRTEQSTIHIKLDCSVYTCLTQLYDGRDMYKNVLHKDQLHGSAIYIDHHQVEK